MYLVIPDPTHGLVAAPQSTHDRTPHTEQALTTHGFTWNNDIEAYTRPANHDPAAVDDTAGLLRQLGHYVLSTHTPLPQTGTAGHGANEDHPPHTANLPVHPQTSPSLGLWDAKACAEANSSAAFHPQEHPDHEGLPCIELAGILIFAYLDADLRAVRISVHLDTTHEQLVRADGAVPIRVEIDDTTIFDNHTPPAPPEPTR
ncbi:hypothetical protein AB0I66_42800 [Streptomyces sp. NPDC050439]|uniref:hypothetical protein n=1 Tax=unclassified Streptomyces TaxID=2593676 RepID=UPI0034384126